MFLVTHGVIEKGWFLYGKVSIWICPESKLFLKKGLFTHGGGVGVHEGKNKFEYYVEKASTTALDFRGVTWSSNIL